VHIDNQMIFYWSISGRVEVQSGVQCSSLNQKWETQSSNSKS